MKIANNYLFHKWLIICLCINIFCATLFVQQIAHASPLHWVPCPDNKDYFCEKLKVPLDYKHPKNKVIHLSLRLHKATERSHGYLMMNFGGPWANNVAALPSILKNKLTPTMVKYFDIIAMNPRTVEPNNIECHTSHPEEYKALSQTIKRIFAQGSSAQLGELYDLTVKRRKICDYDKMYKYTSTKNSVEDIEELRKSLNVSKLNFYMLSYGTKLGLGYLLKYPQHVDKIILDAIVSPSNKLISLIGKRAKGALLTFHTFFNNCAQSKNACPLNLLASNSSRNTGEYLIQQFDKLVRRAESNQGIPTTIKYKNKKLTAGMLKNLMYSEMNTANWTKLAKAIYEAKINNNSDKLMSLYVDVTGYNPSSGNYKTENNYRHQAVICKDYDRPNFNRKKDWIKFNTTIQKEYSEVGLVSTLWMTPMCIEWPGASEPLFNTPTKKSDGLIVSPKILLIGNKYDPMTPLDNLFETIEYLNARGFTASSIEWNAVNHTALMPPHKLSPCVFDKVDRFLLNQKIGKFYRCQDWTNPFLRTDK